MGKSFNNFASLKQAILKEVISGVEEATEKSLEKLQENVDFFYTAPEGKYKRTGQLKSSPTFDGINYTSNGAVGQISINTSTQYYPAGRDTEWIYNLAENDGLLGYGGFWRGTESEIQEILDSEMKKRF